MWRSFFCSAGDLIIRMRWISVVMSTTLTLPSWIISALNPASGIRKMVSRPCSSPRRLLLRWALRQTSIVLAKRLIPSSPAAGDDQQRKVGGAIRIFRDEVPRGQIFVTTKVTCCPSDRCSHFCDKPPNSVGLRATANATEQIHHSLALLGVEYVDLLLLHFPCSRFEDTARAYAQLEAIHASGRARAIGVSNLNASALKALLAVAKVKPAVNQVGLSIAGHPASHDGKAAGCEEGSRRYGSDLDTVSFGRRHGVTTMAYSPLGRISHVDVLGQRRVQKAAERHKKTSAQVALRWLTQQGIAAVTATSNSQHAAEALDSSSFDLTWWEMRALSGLR